MLDRFPSDGRKWMRLSDIKTYVTVPPTGSVVILVIIKLTTDDGIEGIGECYGIPVSGDVACVMAEDTLRASWQERIHTASKPCSGACIPPASPAGRTCHDGRLRRSRNCHLGHLGKAADKPVYQLLGGRFHDRLRTYTYLYPRSITDPAWAGRDEPDVYHDADAAAERALEYLEMGFTAVKQDPAGPYSFQGARALIA